MPRLSSRSAYFFRPIPSACSVGLFLCRSKSINIPYVVSAHVDNDWEQVGQQRLTDHVRRLRGENEQLRRRNRFAAGALLLVVTAAAVNLSAQPRWQRSG